MSEQLRHKMIDFEATPPPAAWNAIAARLEDDVRYSAVATKMNNFDAFPASDDTWSAVSARLDDDVQYAAFAIKMNHFETIPPHSSWSIIATRLDDDRQYAALAKKMNNFDAMPPSQIWNNIADSLQQTTSEATPVISVRHIIYRIAAAAVVVGLFVGAWVLVNKNTSKIEVAKNPNTSNAVHSIPKGTDSSNKDSNSSDSKTVIAGVQDQQQPGQDDTKKRSSSMTANIGSIGGRLLKYTIVHSLPAYQKAPIVITYSPILDKEGNVIRDMDVLTTSNYITVTGPNGQSTRISSKFANVIRLLNGNGDNDASEEYIDQVIRDSDMWKKRFKEWRSKISQSAFIPSAANFLDIIEFKELIQEKQ